MNNFKKFRTMLSRQPLRSGQKGKRIYPQSLFACTIVWILDRLSCNVRKQILDSYYSKSDLELAKIQGEKLWKEFNLNNEKDNELN